MSAASLRRQGLDVETVGDILTDGDDSFRAQHVGASEVAALFPEAGGSPWVTQFELWHRKRGTIAAPDFAGNERMLWGLLLEPVILDEACRRYGWERVETPKRLSNGKGLGGHPDRFVRRKSDGKIGCVEAKAVDWLQYKKWGDEPTLPYLIQPQAYCGLGKLEWCAIVALVGGNELNPWEFEFRPRLYAEIESRVAKFWESVGANEPPAPDYSRDRSTISALFDDPADTLIDLMLDNRATYACADYLAAAAEEKAAKGRKEAAAAELLDKLGNNLAARIDGYSLRAPLVAAIPDRKITAAMIGDTITGRKEYRRIYIKEKA